MKNRPSLVAVFLLAALSNSGCSRQHGTGQSAGAPAAVVAGVVLETVKRAALPDTLEVVGTVRARTAAVLSARVAGSVSALHVREGDRVRRGQLLVQLDALENRAAAAAATAAADEAGRALDEALSRKRQADATFERYRNLFSEQAVSRQEFENRLTDKELAGQGAARAEARLKQAREGARAAATVDGYTRVVAPISGVITAKAVDLGATVFPAQPLMTIEDEGSYQLELAIPESMAAKVKPGMAVQLALDGLDRTFAADINEIVPFADPASRTFNARINLRQKGLRSGMFGRATIALGSAADGLLVAKKSVVERGALTSVWIVDKGGKVRMRLVKVGKTLGDRLEILAGLSAGERVVVGGIEKVTEGARVE